jgi:glycosyltransferase involved in cell wall biosynthesis
VRLTAIVPTLDEAARIGSCLEALRSEFDGEILIADGGSRDATVEIARSFGARACVGPRGLARQCDLAAGTASGDTLFFVSADSRPSPGWHEALRGALASPYVAGGGFRLELDDSTLGLRIITWGGNFRSRFLRLALGDQGLFVRRSVFDAAHGMDPGSLIPFARLSFEIQRFGEFVLLGLPMISSAREWKERGIFRATISHMVTYLRFKYRELPH